MSLNQIAMPDSLYYMMLERIVFQEDELADLYFSGGKRAKCFFKVSDFNPTSTYTIDLDRSEEIDIRLFVTHVPRGLQVSYEAPASGGMMSTGDIFSGICGSEYFSGLSSPNTGSL